MNNIKRIINTTLLLMVAATVTMGQGLANLKLNEVMVNNTNSLVNENGERSGWIEIRNTSWSTIDISGCYITNNPEVLNEALSAPERIELMSKIPGGDKRTKIAPQSTLVIYADGSTNLGTLHANFFLKPVGENFLALYEANGTKQIDQVKVPADLGENESYARFGEDWRICTGNDVTPGAANDMSASKKDKIAEFKEKDPHGFAMTILGMGIVLSGLAFLCIFFLIFGAIMRRISGGNKEAEKTVAPATVATPVAPKAMDKADDAVYAAIAMALHELEEDAHDEESGIITITPAPSSWASHAVTLAAQQLH